jgi:ATP-dependent Clp protease ATP-binding subunit ClpA
VLEMAVHEGKDLGQNFVGTEHILLALIAGSDGVAMRTLDKLNVDIQVTEFNLNLYRRNTRRNFTSFNTG